MADSTPNTGVSKLQFWSGIITVIGSVLLNLLVQWQTGNARFADHQDTKAAVQRVIEGQSETHDKIAVTASAVQEVQATAAKVADKVEEVKAEVKAGK